MALIYTDPQSWDPSTGYTNAVSWAEALIAKSASDSLVLGITEVSAVAETTIKSATDTALLVSTDTGYPPVVTGSTNKSANDAPVLVVTETAVVLDLTLKSASDALVLAIASENYQLFSTEGTPKAATDALLLALTEAPNTSRLARTDDAVLVGFSAEIGTSPFAVKAVSDTLILQLPPESWEIVTGSGETFVSGSDTLLLAVSDTAVSIVQDTVIAATDALLLAVADIGYPPVFDDVRAASDALLLSVADTSHTPAVVYDEKTAADDLLLVVDETHEIVLPVVKEASDTLLLAIGDASRSIAFFEAPPIGVLPPGWLEIKLEELTGIERPRRYETGNVEPIKGWFKRTYWAIYDDKGRLRATDRWRDTARAQAWTQYHAGKQAAAA